MPTEQTAANSGHATVSIDDNGITITLDTPEGERRVVQIGTGNYNEKTARLYTDLSLMTAREEIGEEAISVFEALL